MRTLPAFLVGLLLSACTIQILPPPPPPSSVAPKAQTGTVMVPPVGPPPARLPRPTSSTGSLLERLADHGLLETGSESGTLLTIFTNPACAYCARFFDELLPEVERRFVDPGYARLQFVIVPLKKYPGSAVEASALGCAAAQGKGKVMLEAMTHATNHNRATVLALAKTAKLATKEFTTCLDSRNTKDLLQQQADIIAANQVTLLPTFLLNNQNQIGLPSSADMRGWIAERLKL